MHAHVFKLGQNPSIPLRRHTRTPVQQLTASVLHVRVGMAFWVSTGNPADSRLERAAAWLPAPSSLRFPAHIPGPPLAPVFLGAFTSGPQGFGVAAPRPWPPVAQLQLDKTASQFGGSETRGVGGAASRPGGNAPQLDSRSYWNRLRPPLVTELVYTRDALGCDDLLAVSSQPALSRWTALGQPKRSRGKSEEPSPAMRRSVRQRGAVLQDTRGPTGLFERLGGLAAVAADTSMPAPPTLQYHMPYASGSVLVSSAPRVGGFVPAPPAVYVHPSAEASLVGDRLVVAAAFARLHRAEIINDKKGKRADAGHASVPLRRPANSGKAVDHLGVTGASAGGSGSGAASAQPQMVYPPDVVLPRLPELAQSYCRTNVAPAEGELATSVFHALAAREQVEFTVYSEPQGVRGSGNSSFLRRDYVDEYGVPHIWKTVKICKKCGQPKKASCCGKGRGKWKRPGNKAVDAAAAASRLAARASDNGEEYDGDEDEDGRMYDASGLGSQGYSNEVAYGAYDDDN